jgi:hypothetical protein
MWMGVVASVLGVAAPRPAQAMGRYTTLNVVAWSADGSAALVLRSTTSSGTAGEARQYALVTAGEAKPASFVFFDTTDPEAPKQTVAAKSCEAAAVALVKALTVHHFKGVAVDRARCKTADRQVVAVSPEAALVASLAYVAAPKAHDATPRETAAAAALAVQDGDALALSDKLVLVLFGENGNDSKPAHGAVFAGGKKVVEDLRGD